ncbi:MAG TPA: hypothetical protein VNZ57_08930 [Longimicrobiales bacterium]|nr:hypothetical protein [Longimicrobiales bacterium]
MSTSPSTALHREVEALLSRLAGILAVNIVWDPAGTIARIHVLASPDKQPKLIVRNVESALMAGLGIDIDRRIVSVAQVAGSTPANSGFPVASNSSVPYAGSRAVLTRFEVQRRVGGKAKCRVELEWQGHQLVGEAEGAGTPLGRIQTAARAVFHALAEIPGSQPIALDAAGFAEAHGYTYVVVCGRIADVRESAVLTGAAAVSESLDRAAILAALQATDRHVW